MEPWQRLVGDGVGLVVVLEVVVCKVNQFISTEHMTYAMARLCLLPGAFRVWRCIIVKSVFFMPGPLGAAAE